MATRARANQCDAERSQRAVDGLGELLGAIHADSYERVGIVMSLSAAVFLPASFLTGVYGMNFVGEMPLIDNPHGYATFWCLVAGIWGSIGMLFWVRGWCQTLSTGRKREDLTV